MYSNTFCYTCKSQDKKYSNTNNYHVNKQLNLVTLFISQRLKNSIISRFLNEQLIRENVILIKYKIYYIIKFSTLLYFFYFYDKPCFRKTTRSLTGSINQDKSVVHPHCFCIVYLYINLLQVLFLKVVFSKFLFIRK